MVTYGLQVKDRPLLRFQPSTGKYDIIHSVHAPMQMKVDQKTGNIWFTTFDANKIGVIQQIPKTKTITNINNNITNGYGRSSSSYKASNNNSSISQYKVD